MGKPIADEIAGIESTVRWTFQQEVRELKLLLHRWTDEPLVVVGSGGSYSAAAAWAQLHRKYTGQVATSISPLLLENLLDNQTARRLLLVSAEGKNSDILNAAHVARALDVPTAALTLTPSNALLDYAVMHNSLFAFPFDFDCKDGYLATNSLIATILLAGRVYEDATSFSQVEKPIRAIAKRRELLRATLPPNILDRGALVLFGPDTSLFAIDLESKFTEAALTHCQVVDYRQFAHGRHLQLSVPPERLPVVIAAYSDRESAIAAATVANFPSSVEVFRVPISGDTTTELALSNALEAILLTEAVGRTQGKDPGQPDVPIFGRSIYSIDVAQLVNRVQVATPFSTAVLRKRRYRTATEAAHLTGHANRFREKLCSAEIRGVVFDFDGTLCDVHQRYGGIRSDLAKALSKLIDGGITVGIATGRGRSVVDSLRKHIPKSQWGPIFLGLYSGSHIGTLEAVGVIPEPNPEFDVVIAWLKATSLACVLDANPPKARVGQLAFRIGDHRIARELAVQIAEWIYQTNRTGWRVFSSGHSVDLLAPNASKLNVLRAMQAELGLDPTTQVLRIGDAGEVGGNDYELLAEGLSVSVERTSAALDTCWNFSPSGVRQADATMYYLRQMSVLAGVASILLPSDSGNLESNIGMPQ